MHAEVYTAGLTTGVDSQTEVALPAGRLEHLHRKQLSLRRTTTQCNGLIGLVGR